jgi:hypothetical protein
MAAAMIAHFVGKENLARLHGRKFCSRHEASACNPVSSRCRVSIPADSDAECNAIAVVVGRSRLPFPGAPCRIIVWEPRVHTWTMACPDRGSRVLAGPYRPWHGPREAPGGARPSAARAPISSARVRDSAIRPQRAPRRFGGAPLVMSPARRTGQHKAAFCAGSAQNKLSGVLRLCCRFNS